MIERWYFCEIAQPTSLLKGYQVRINKLGPFIMRSQGKSIKQGYFNCEMMKIMWLKAFKIAIWSLLIISTNFFMYLFLQNWAISFVDWVVRLWSFSAHPGFGHSRLCCAKGPGVFSELYSDEVLFCCAGRCIIFAVEEITVPFSKILTDDH
jgi:hypothetical protein